MFSKGVQAQFILACKFKLECDLRKIAFLLGVGDRTIRSWVAEEKKMSHCSALHLSKISGISIPENAKIVTWSEHAKMAGKKGGINKYAKYGSFGDENKRKEAWKTWWEKTGKYKDQKILQRKVIHIPEKDIYLAEFVGIMMGDGNINENAIRITLDSWVDREYILYVEGLLKRLFLESPKLYFHKTKRCVDIVIASKNLVEFCLSVGLKKGNKIKNGLDIPDWIKANEKFSLVCVRGLVDTDGCFFKHSYVVNSKRYSYMKMAFTSKSAELLNSVRAILIKLGLCVRMTKDGNDIRIDKQKDVWKYVEIIGTSNQKFRDKLIQGDVSEPG